MPETEVSVVERAVNCSAVDLTIASMAFASPASQSFAMTSLKSTVGRLCAISDPHVCHLRVFSLCDYSQAPEDCTYR